MAESTAHARIAVLLDRVRVEEKLLLQAFEARHIPVDVRDDREVILDLDAHRRGEAANSYGRGEWARYAVVLDRCITHARAVAALRILNDWGVCTINHVNVVETCGDKLATSSALVRAGIPTPRVMVAFTPEAALQAIETMGYPVVL
jgi:[lysine-biosynthesis-protein LysW]--L-2-aminoadipate ligase